MRYQVPAVVRLFPVLSLELQDLRNGCFLSDHRKNQPRPHIFACRQSPNGIQNKLSSFHISGFDGLEVSVLAFGTQVREFKPGRSRRIFRAKKIHSTSSFGGEVKPSVPCRKFTACKRTQKWRSRHFRQNSRQFLAHSSTFCCWGSLTSFQTWGTPGGGSWNVLNHWSSKLGVWRAAGNGTL